MGTLQDSSEVTPDSNNSSAGSHALLREPFFAAKKSGLAAWLGWLFDGLDMHLYVLVATPFVGELLGKSDDLKHPDVGFYSSWIQAAFLFGWAIGGGFFGRIADRL